MTITFHERTFDIEWGDMDALGHINNARYFDYFQESRIQWLGTLGFTLGEKKGPVVISMTATYFKAVVYPATLTIRSKAHSPGRSSFLMDHEIYQNDILVTQGQSKIVWVDYKKNQSIPIPDKILKLFET
ncbi:acyl-CoA thioesterase [Legionella sp. W05-934-2]|jgi:acyl-CoA thioester hydrolase|uniref:acyl-CoA thioesterase n=1 Tax=Legionella sp. W05-934-2 TaxID=1198649 RepID=UPI0034620565